MTKKGVLTRKFFVRSGLAGAALLGMTHLTHMADQEDENLALEQYSASMIDHQSNTTAKTDRLRFMPSSEVLFTDLWSADLSINVDLGSQELIALPAEVSRYTQQGFKLRTVKAPVSTVPVVVTSPVEEHPPMTDEQFDERYNVGSENDSAHNEGNVVERPEFSLPNACGVHEGANAYFTAVINGSDGKATRLQEILDSGQREFYPFSLTTTEITENNNVYTLSEMQSALKTMGCLSGNVNASFDETTTAAVMSFQQAVKGKYADIKPTGRADPATMRALGHEAMRVLFYNGKRDFLTRYLNVDVNDYAIVAPVEGGCAEIDGLQEFQEENGHLETNLIAADIGVQQNYVPHDLKPGDSDRGAYGPVRLAQFQLATLQCTGSATIKHGAIDGQYGYGTEKWVKRFQTQYGEKYGLEVTGKLDESTRAALSYESSKVIAFINAEIDRRSKEYGVDAEKLTRLFMHESLGVPIMASGTGPAGLGQPTQSLSKSMASELGYERPVGTSEIVDFQTNIAKNVHISAYYFGGLLNTAENKAPTFSDNLQFQMAYTSYRDGPNAGIRAIKALLRGDFRTALGGSHHNGTTNIAVGSLEAVFDRKMNEPHKVGRGHLFNSMRAAYVSAKDAFTAMVSRTGGTEAADANILITSNYQSLPHPLAARYSGLGGRGLY